MAQSAPLPHLFGRFTTVLRGHADLQATLKLLRSMCAAIEDQPERLTEELTPSHLLRRFRDELTAHFAAEESYAHFGAIVEEEPGLATSIAELRHEHLLILRALDMLSNLAIDELRWSHLPRPTRELLQRLEQHERAETLLLRQLFGQRVP
jgi:hypothetical protein